MLFNPLGTTVVNPSNGATPMLEIEFTKVRIQFAFPLFQSFAPIVS